MDRLVSRKTSTLRIPFSDWGLIDFSFKHEVDCPWCCSLGWKRNISLQGRRAGFLSLNLTTEEDRANLNSFLFETSHPNSFLIWENSPGILTIFSSVFFSLTSFFRSPLVILYTKISYELLTVHRRVPLGLFVPPSQCFLFFRNSLSTAVSELTLASLGLLSCATRVHGRCWYGSWSRLAWAKNGYFPWMRRGVLVALFFSLVSSSSKIFWYFLIPVLRKLKRGLWRLEPQYSKEPSTRPQHIFEQTRHPNTIVGTQVLYSSGQYNLMIASGWIFCNGQLG